MATASVEEWGEDPDEGSERRAVAALEDVVAIRVVGNGRYAVQTWSGVHVVDQDRRVCGCSDYRYSERKECKHTLAVELGLRGLKPIERRGRDETVNDADGRLSSRECAAMRLLYRDGYDPGELKMMVGLSNRGHVWDHLAGRCSHRNCQAPIADSERREGHAPR